MNILSYLITIELIRLGITAARFNQLADRERMGIFNEVRFQLKSRLRNHPDILPGIDRKIADILFAGCDDVEH
jgi:hypothetical protein